MCTKLLFFLLKIYIVQLFLPIKRTIQRAKVWQNPQRNGTGTGENPVTAVKCQDAHVKTHVNRIERYLQKISSVIPVTLYLHV